VPAPRLTVLTCVVAAALAAPAPAGAAARIFTVAGNGRFTLGSTPSPLGHMATDVEAEAPDDVAVTPSGDVLFTDFGRVWRVGPDGIVRVAAGTGHTPEFADEPLTGDGGPAERTMVEPGALAALPDGGFLIAEPWDVRRVWPDGTCGAWRRTAPSRRWRGPAGPGSRATVAWRCARASIRASTAPTTPTATSRPRPTAAS
jgi:hypothetical protein